MSSPQLRDEDFSPEALASMRQMLESWKTSRAPQFLNRLKLLLPEETYARCEALIEAKEWDALQNCIRAFVDDRSHVFALTVDATASTVKSAREFRCRVLEARESVPLGLNMEVAHFVIHERGVERLEAKDEARRIDDDTK